jgi:hypothetical protein
MTDNFTKKQLQASITINPSSTTPTFNGTDSNTITFGGGGDNAIRMHAEINNAGGIDDTMNLSAWGLPLDVLNQLSTYGTQLNLLPKNQVSLQAGDENGLAQAYLGSIIACVVDPQPPDLILHITAQASAGFAAATSAPTSFNGSVAISTVMSQIAQKMGLTFENNGVTGTMANVYLYGSPRDQYTDLVQHANISATIDRGVLAIWPKFKNRNGQVIEISPDDGTMQEYPSYTGTGVSLKALYNPNFAIGRQVKVSGSIFTPVNTTWNLYGVNHALSCELPGGPWQSELMATTPNFSTPVIP